MSIKSSNLSALQKNWQAKKIDERQVLRITQQHSISEILAKLLNIRKVDFDEINNFLNPKIKNYLPNPFDLADMDIAVKTVIDAIEKKKKITIFGDYDVDGATSSAILKRYFMELGVICEIYIPDRILEGYGPNSQALENLKNNKTDLVIMVDCGTVAFEPLEYAKKIGLEIIVIDHHLGVINKPKAIAVINPNFLNEKFLYKNICAAGVVFLFLVAINKSLRNNNFFDKIEEPDLLSLLDLVALGTVCDVMPLTGLNRAFVSVGLKIMQQRKNTGIKAICELAQLNSAPSSYNLGFIIGPRINAGGRVGTSNLGATILSTNDENEANKIAAKLEELNNNRKKIENEVLMQAIDNLENNIGGFNKNNEVIFAVGYDWHQGVIGIIASRLKEIYQKPVAVIAMDSSTKKAKASCRSINGVDFGIEILKAKLNGLIIEGGGHAMAGGFSIEIEKIKTLHDFFIKNLSSIVTEINEKNLHEFDLEIDFSQINLDLIKELNQMEPFGNGNPKPKFLVKDLYKIRHEVIGKNKEHLSLIFSSKSNIGYTNTIQGLLFKANMSSLLTQFINLKNNHKIDVIATLEINNWMGVEKIKLLIEDLIIKE